MVDINVDALAANFAVFVMVFLVSDPTGTVDVRVSEQSFSDGLNEIICQLPAMHYGHRYDVANDIVF